MCLGMLDDLICSLIPRIQRVAALGQDPSTTQGISQAAGSATEALVLVKGKVQDHALAGQQPHNGLFDLLLTVSH